MENRTDHGANLSLDDSRSCVTNFRTTKSSVDQIHSFTCGQDGKEKFSSIGTAVSLALMCYGFGCYFAT